MPDKEGYRIELEKTGALFHQYSVPPEYQYVEICSLFSDRIEIVKKFGSGNLQTLETRPLVVQGNMTIPTLIEKASAEMLELKDNLICDVPTTTVMAFTESGSNVKIFFSGSCGNPLEFRRGPYSETLRRLIDGYCPKTHDVGN